MSDDEVRPLCDERLAPITFSIGFLRAPLEQVAKSLHLWRAAIYGSAEWISFTGGLVENARRLEPLTGGARPRELLVATSGSDWTALFDCGVQGGDQTTTVGFLARSMQWQGVVVVYIADRKDRTVPGRFGAHQLEMFGPVETDFLNYVRSISLVRDEGRWHFEANGTIQDFEDTSAYRRRKVIESFTPRMLRDYARALGIRAFEEDFYPGPSALITSPVSPPPGALIASLDQAQQMLR